VTTGWDYIDVRKHKFLLLHDNQSVEIDESLPDEILLYFNVSFSAVGTPRVDSGRQEFSHGQMPAGRMRRLMAIPAVGDTDSCLK
jgi:hypothetical protein